MSNSQFHSSNIPFRTAVKSGGSGCIQVARQEGMILIGDSKHAGGPVLSYTPKEFDAFLDGAKKGEFDDFLN